MTIVTNQTELQNALSSSETEIQIANNFEITLSMAINSTVSISSTPNNVFTLLKNSSFLGVVFSVQNNATLTLINIILDGNKENHDLTNPGNNSLIVVSAGTLILGENSILQNNFCYTNGGAIAQYNGSVIPVLQIIMRDNAIIQNCTSRQFGGGIYSELRNVDSSLFIRDNAVIKANQGNGGGGIYISPYVNSPTNISITGNVILESNSSTRGGGAIQLSGMGNQLKTLNITGATIQNNMVTGEGGGMYIYNCILNLNQTNFIGNKSRSGGGIFSSSEFEGTITIENCNFTSNLVGDQIGYGGGISILQQGTAYDFILTITNSNFKNNGRGRYGGAIYTSNTLNTFTNIEVSDNSAILGGGIHYTSRKSGYLNIIDSKIINNEAVGDGAIGGGIYFEHTSNTDIDLNITNTIIDNNVSNGLAGGIYCSDAENGLDIEIENTFITNNKSIQDSGGMHLILAGTDTMTCLNSQFMNNTSNNSGGAINFVKQGNGNSVLQFTDTKFSSNMALDDGGAFSFTTINPDGIASITFTNCTISDNSASNGGGIYNNGNTIYLSSSTIIENKASIGGSIFNGG